MDRCAPTEGLEQEEAPMAGEKAEWGVLTQEGAGPELGPWSPAALSSEHRPWACLRAVGSPASCPGRLSHSLRDLRPCDSSLCPSTTRSVHVTAVAAAYHVIKMAAERQIPVLCLL